MKQLSVPEVRLPHTPDDASAATGKRATRARSEP